MMRLSLERVLQRYILALNKNLDVCDGVIEAVVPDELLEKENNRIIQV